MRAGGSDDVAAPGVVTAMRQRANRTQVAHGCHFGEAAKSRDLEAEAVGYSLRNRAKHRVLILGVFVEVDGMRHPPLERRHLLHRIARLLEHEWDRLAEAIEVNSGGNRQSAVAIDRNARLETDRLPHLVNRRDIFLEVSTGY